jgi:hypothetical protein
LLLSHIWTPSFTGLLVSADRKMPRQRTTSADAATHYRAMSAASADNENKTQVKEDVEGNDSKKQRMLVISFVAMIGIGLGSCRVLRWN